MSRARAFYTYDPAGRTKEVDHYWDTFNTTNNTWNTSQYLVGNSCSYETSGLNRGLKLQDSYLGAITWTQTYGYDSTRDYLTSASYGDGQANASQTWTYDAAGNRTSDYTGTGWTYDNLNRMTASPAGAYTNDVLGNRLTFTPSGGGAGHYTWDSLNRLIATTQPTPSPNAASTASVSYTYRADGMRVQKTDHSGQYQVGSPGSPGGEVDDQYAWYRYDGQMPMETAITKADGSHEVIDNGLGARGIDYVQITQIPITGSPTVTVAYPLYDAHGNEVATLSRSGSSYALNNERSYDAWGEVRQGAATGGPRGRYCGQLGHVQNDETGLVYMRARYYEPSGGRFLSEDSAQNGSNWFIYCSNLPTSCGDPSGQYSVPLENILLAIGMGFALLAAQSYAKYDPSYIGSVQTAQFLGLCGGFAGIAVAFFAASQFVAGNHVPQALFTKLAIAVTGVAGILAVMSAGAAYGARTAAAGAVLGCFVYGLVLEG